MGWKKYKVQSARFKLMAELTKKEMDLFKEY